MNARASKSNNIGLWIFLSTLLVALTISALVVYNNNQSNKRAQQIISAEKAKTDKEENQRKIEQETRTAKLTICLEDAQDNYNRLWNDASQSYGRNDGKLPENEAARYDQLLKDGKDECYRNYGG